MYLGLHRGGKTSFCFIFFSSDFNWVSQNQTQTNSNDQLKPRQITQGINENQSTSNNQSPQTAGKRVLQSRIWFCLLFWLIGQSKAKTISGYVDHPYEEFFYYPAPGWRYFFLQLKISRKGWLFSPTLLIILTFWSVSGRELLYYAL